MALMIVKRWINNEITSALLDIDSIVSGMPVPASVGRDGESWTVVRLDNGDSMTVCLSMYDLKDRAADGWGSRPDPA